MMRLTALVSKAEEVQAAIKQVEADFGRIDNFIANAGGYCLAIQ